MGSCGLHVINGAFQTGNNASGWQINRLLRAMYRLFKDVPARRAQYTEITGKTLIPMKFCQIRWTQNVAVGKRALEVFDDVCKFVKTAKLPQITSVASIKEASSNPLAKAKIACFISIAQSLEGFLTTFQSPSPLAPFLDLMELVKSLMLPGIKTDRDVASVSRLPRGLPTPRSRLGPVDERLGSRLTLGPGCLGLGLVGLVYKVYFTQNFE